MTESDDLCRRSAERRAILGAGVALVPFLAGVARAEDPGPASLPPQPGDQFAFLSGEKKGQIVKTDDIPLGGPQLQVYPIDPKSGVVRDGSRLNLVILARFDPASFDDATRAPGRWRGRLFRCLHPSGLRREHVGERGEPVVLLVPWVDLRPAARGGGDRRSGAAGTPQSCPEGGQRCADGRRRVLRTGWTRATLTRILSDAVID
jgi:hypothetical protein